MLFQALLSLFLAPAVLSITITSDASTVANRTFDYVIVGGGLAGLTVASRLAEVANINILVIEAGEDQQNNTRINDPAQWQPLSSSQWSWNYTTVPQTVGGLVQTIAQGFALGGSSAINGLQWNRGTKDQYNAWELLGNPGWNWQSMLSYMKKAEKFTIPSAGVVAQGASYISAVHGQSGLVHSGFPEPLLAGQVFKDIIAAARTAVPSLKRAKDFGSGKPNGAGTNMYSIKPGPVGTTGQNVRSTSATSYVYPFLNTKHGLTILIKHQATKMTWGANVGGKAKANGVEFVPTPAPNAILPPPFSVQVSKEVIVAAGAFGSPHFLELSGVGDSAILAAASIPLKVNLSAVGTNLQDHASTVQLYSLNSSVPAENVTPTNNPGVGALVFPDIYQTLGAARAAVVGVQLLASINSRAQDLVDSGGFSSLSGAKKVLAYQATSVLVARAPVCQIAFAAVGAAPRPILNALWCLLPMKRGSVHTISNNAAVRPRIDPAFLEDPLDLELHAKAVNMSRAIFNTQPLKSYVTAETAPGLANVPADGTLDQFKTWVSNNYHTGFHPLGTVPLLPKEDGGAVDPHLLVYGTKNVRVVDSSIIPVQISANPSGTTYGVAEKAADIIKSAM